MSIIRFIVVRDQRLARVVPRVALLGVSGAFGGGSGAAAGRHSEAALWDAFFGGVTPISYTAYPHFDIPAEAARNESAQYMPQDANHLIWIDMEMTGLKPDVDRIIEVALVITDSNLEVISEAPVLVVHQEAAVLSAMDEWNQATHTRTGLIPKVASSVLSEAEVEAQMVAFLQQHVPAKTSPMCGNSICQDRRFLARWMPQLEEYFHYRNLDVSTIKELVKRWSPEVARGVTKNGKHEALADIYESVEELKHYRQHFFRT